MVRRCNQTFNMVRRCDQTLLFCTAPLDMVLDILACRVSGATPPTAPPTATPTAAPTAPTVPPSSAEWPKVRRRRRRRRRRGLGGGD